MIDTLLQAAIPYGPVGLLCVYFIWREEKRDKRDDSRDARLDDLSQERIVADKALAVAMTLLAERIK